MKKYVKPIVRSCNMNVQTFLTGSDVSASIGGDTDVVLGKDRGWEEDEPEF